jgi:AbrB family looped-hinge helix DNA binding protein
MKMKLRKVNGAEYVLIPKPIRDLLELNGYVELNFIDNKIIIEKYSVDKSVDK